jgi:hypothetical protein
MMRYVKRNTLLLGSTLGREVFQEGTAIQAHAPLVVAANLRLE